MAQPAFSDDVLTFNERLERNQYLESSNRSFRLVMQGDGNLVLRDWNTRNTLWSSGTHNQNATRVTFQEDGNLVIRNGNRQALWSSGTNGKRAERAILQNDGNFVIYSSSGAALWSTDTAREIVDTIKPIIKLRGASEISIEEGQVFNDPGATAEDNKDGDISNRITATGNVNTRTPGIYSLNYNVLDVAGNAADTVTRSVEVTAKPVEISDRLLQEQLLNINERLISPNGRYLAIMQSDGNLVVRETDTRQAIWASATNGLGAIRIRLQRDGNLVMRKADGSPVWSTGTHVSGANRLVMQNDSNLVLYTENGTPVWASNDEQQDNIKPTISLIGPTIVTMTQGTGYTDSGATAHDDVDGDISDRINLSGSLNTNQPGRYTLSYNVSDTAGNAADQVIRTIVVEKIEEPEPIKSGRTASSTGKFSTPSAAVYALNDSRPRGFPRVIDHEYGGNGSAETWDGRIFVRTRSAGWYATAFRPERISRNADNTVNFSGAFGRDLEFELKSEAQDMQHNWLAIVKDPAVSGENPYPSDANGNYLTNGSYATYRAMVYHTSKRNGDNDQMGLRRATFIVQNANTRDAQIIRADFTSSFERMRLQNGNDFRCIEPSATVDGHLVICQGHPDNNGRIDNLVYSWNPQAGAASNWRAPKSIANMYWDDRHQEVQGMPFSVRFPIAQRPILDATGNDFNRNELIKGAYPWISHDGSELFYQASNDGTSGRRTGTSVIGRWTGWTIRHIDGPINRNRADTNQWPATGRRLFISSPGAFTTMWSPYKNVDDLKIPYSVRGPSYPIFGTNSRDYSEVGFEDYTDGNYVLYFGLNEQLDRAGRFQTTRTNDTSGHFNNGRLVGARFPVEYNNRDELVGRYGQAIYFESNQYIEVDKRQGWESFDKGASVDFWIRKINGTDTIRLFHLSGGIEIYLTNGNRINATVTDVNNVSETISGGTVTNNEWQHIAVTLDQYTKSFTLYLNGVEIENRTISQFDALNTSGTLRIGPDGSSTLLLLDEVKVSNISREPYEITYAANRMVNDSASSQLASEIPDYLRTLRFNTTNINGFSREAAKLGEQLFNDKILSKQQTTSCATCHNETLAFTDGLSIAQGNEPTDAGTRNTPSLLNRLFSSFQGWSGLANRLDNQAIIPITARHEMNLPLDEAIDRLENNRDYFDRFQAIYGEGPSEENITSALASFQALQFSLRNAVDNFNQGDRTALTASERRGKDLFENKARCSGCHAGVNYTDETFRNNGLTFSNDIGRAEVTGRDRDHKLFKVPTLRSVNLTAPYMHDGSIMTLRDVIEAYNDGAPGDPAVDSDIRPLELTNEEIDDLINYLRAL